MALDERPLPRSRPSAGSPPSRRSPRRLNKGAAVYVLAVSDFLRSVFLILVATPFILLWGGALLDLIRGTTGLGDRRLDGAHPRDADHRADDLLRRAQADGHEVDEKYLADRELQRPRRPARRRPRPRALLARVEDQQRAGPVRKDRVGAARPRSGKHEYHTAARLDGTVATAHRHWIGAAHATSGALIDGTIDRRRRAARASPAASSCACSSRRRSRLRPLLLVGGDDRDDRRLRRRRAPHTQGRIVGTVLMSPG